MSPASGAGEAGGGDESERFDWVALAEDLRRRLGQFGMRERSGEVDDFGLDPETIRSARAAARSLLRKRWWRIEVVGLEHVPADRPVLFVANHSGLLPWDGLALAETIEEAHGAARRPRFLIADWLITLPFVQPALARLGGVRACRENAERLLATGRSVVAFPEGVKGAAKTFRDRYRLQRFGRGGAVRLALAAGVPIVPVAIVGAEEAHPILFKLETPGARARPAVPAGDADLPVARPARRAAAAVEVGGLVRRAAGVREPGARAGGRRPARGAPDRGAARGGAAAGEGSAAHPAGRVRRSR